MFLRKHRKFRDNWKENRIGLLLDINEDEELAIMNEVFDAGRITIFKEKTEVDMTNMLFYNLSNHDKLKIIYFANMLKDWKDTKDKTVKEWKAMKGITMHKDRTDEQKEDKEKSKSDESNETIMKFDI
jgi:hypothetical protein